MSWRHRGYRIRRHVRTGDYEVLGGPGLDRTVHFVVPSKMGLAETRRRIDVIVDAELKAERDRRLAEEARRRREAEQAERERLWLRDLPSTACRKCGTHHVEAVTEQGHRLPLDTDPDPEGHWVVVAQHIRGRTPVIRRATTEPIADRYEIHHASCRRRIPLVDERGQLGLALGRWVQVAEKPRRKRRRPEPRQRSLSLTAHAEQLSLC